MITPPLPADEPARLLALQSLLILDTPPEERFERVTRLARRMFDAPMVLISLIDADRQWFKSRQGLDVRETPRDVSFCGHAILSERALVVPDARQDPRFVDNPLVIGDPHIRFYAGHPVKAPGGHCIGTLCVLDRRPRDFDEAQRGALAELAALVEREFNAIENEFYRAVAGHMQVGLHVFKLEETEDHPSLRLIVTNDAACQLTGTDRKTVLGQIIDEAFPAWCERDVPSTLSAVVRSGAARGWDEVWPEAGGKVKEAFSMKAFPLPGPYVGVVFETIKAQKIAQQALEELALTDTLTGLPNRRHIHGRITQALKLARRHHRAMAVMFLDMNGFKVVNDTRGHEVGDLALKAFAERLVGSVRASDVVARLGGDEFIVLLPEVASAEDARQVAEKIQAAVSRPFDLAGRTTRLGVSIGISAYPGDASDADALLKQADAAMYLAKQGRHPYWFHKAG